MALPFTILHNGRRCVSVDLLPSQNSLFLNCDSCLRSLSPGAFSLGYRYSAYPEGNELAFVLRGMQPASQSVLIVIVRVCWLLVSISTRASGFLFNDCATATEYQRETSLSFLQSYLMKECARGSKPHPGGNL